MAKKDPFRDKVNQFAQALSDREPTTPIQEVRPVEPVAEPAPAPPIQAAPQRAEKADANPRGAHFNFWGDFDLKDRVALHAFTQRKSIKEVCVEALEFYMAHVGRPPGDKT